MKNANIKSTLHQNCLKTFKTEDVPDVTEDVNRGGFAQGGVQFQSLNFIYLYKSRCKSCELLRAFKGYPII
jgi:hypothetical protein